MTTAAAPHRVQRSRRKGWRKPPNTVCVTRPGRFANHVSRPAEPTHEAHAASVEAFRLWAMAPEQAEYREMVRRELRGHNLACYCSPELPCHSDVLLAIANG
jgi:Domain of unknown function (DUF4326)